MAGHPEKRVSWSGANDSPPGEDIPPPKKFVQFAQLTNRIWHDIIKCSHAKIDGSLAAVLLPQRAEFQIPACSTKILLDLGAYCTKLKNPQIFT